MLGIDLEGMVKSKLKAELHAHPEVIAGLDKADKGLKAFETILKKIPTAAYPALLKAVEGLIAKEVGHSVLTDAEIAELSAEAAQLPDGLHQLEAAIEQAEKLAQ